MAHLLNIHLRNIAKWMPMGISNDTTAFLPEMCSVHKSSPPYYKADPPSIPSAAQSKSSWSAVVSLFPPHIRHIIYQNSLYVSSLKTHPTAHCLSPPPLLQLWPKMPPARASPAATNSHWPFCFQKCSPVILPQPRSQQDLSRTSFTCLCPSDLLPVDPIHLALAHKPFVNQPLPTSLSLIAYHSPSQPLPFHLSVKHAKHFILVRALSST